MRTYPTPRFSCYLTVLVALILLFSSFSLIGCSDRREPNNRFSTKSSPPNPSAGLSKLHRSIIGHWIEYRTHMHAYISRNEIILKKEDETRLESYSYRVFSEDTFLSTLLLKVKQPGDVSEDSWEAQAIDYGDGMKLMIGRAQFSYADSRTKP